MSSTIARATAIVANRKPSRRARARRPRFRGRPGRRALVFSSSRTARASSFASVPACSATCFASRSDARVLSAAGGHGLSSRSPWRANADAEGRAGDRDWIRPGPPLLLRGVLWARRCLRGAGSWLGVLRQLTLGALHHQRRLQLAQKGRVLGELRGDLRRHAAFGGGLVRQLLELVGSRLDGTVALHRFAGGFSPVATRQMPEAARRAAMVAAAPSRRRGRSREACAAWLRVACWAPGKPGRLCTGMHADARPLPKQERQRLIESVIGRRGVGTQWSCARRSLPRVAPSPRQRCRATCASSGSRRCTTSWARRFGLPAPRQALRAGRGSRSAAILERFGRRG